MICKNDELQHNRAVITHHSYVIYSVSDLDKLATDFISAQNFSDVTNIELESFGIDDSRNLIKSAYRQPAGQNEKKLIVVRVGSFTLEAQQSLLKVLEEPPLSTTFLFLLPSENSVIPTLKSRFLEYAREFENVTDVVNENFAEFCALGYKDRLALIVKRLDKDDTLWLKDIKYGLAEMLSNSIQVLKPSQRKSLAIAIETLNTRGASNKMLLEEIALTIPFTA